ncbi:hypothetical protein OUZ56_024253 [Daphnia magna]|uniref:Secreted protein n=1 Tax=Daphnia magna TaxID=35525 RepID=A0ABR0B0F9_9CRUS|nr:hypothetical protein OUZ56_024253 [Daphnia magna]
MAAYSVMHFFARRDFIIYLFMLGRCGLAGLRSGLLRGSEDYCLLAPECYKALVWLILPKTHGFRRNAKFAVAGRSKRCQNLSWILEFLQKRLKLLLPDTALVRHLRSLSRCLSG